MLCLTWSGSSQTVLAAHTTLTSAYHTNSSTLTSNKHACSDMTRTTSAVIKPNTNKQPIQQQANIAVRAASF